MTHSFHLNPTSIFGTTIHARKKEKLIYGKDFLCFDEDLLNFFQGWKGFGLELG